MNERIKGLWWQARIGYNNQNCDPEVLEKFAELIVNDCLDIVDKEVLGMVGVNAMKKIEKHFGIEE